MESTAKLDRLLSDAVKLKTEHERLESVQKEFWPRVQVSMEVLQREMNRAGITTFKGATTKATASITDKTTVEFSDLDRPEIIGWLKENDGGGVVSTNFRKDSLAKFIGEFLEKGGTVPEFMKIKLYPLLKIRRSS